jgi:hypothetical protein
MNKKYQIFVSSTYEDLFETRREVIEQIQKMGHFAAGMEKLSASDAGQWDAISATIRQSDYYVCILGHRYGWAKDKNSISYTEREWDYAKSLNIPIMSFIIRADALVDPSKLDKEAFKKAKLKKFVSKAKNEKIVESWSTSAELCQKVIIAISNSFHTDPRPGWIRADSENVAEQMANLTKENRELRDEVERLRISTRIRVPEFSFAFQGDSNISLKYVDRSTIDLQRRPNVSPIVWEQIPEELIPYLDRSEIDKYNSELPASEEIDSELARIHSIQIAKSTAQEFTITIKNIGEIKANDISVQIEFPMEVIAAQKSTVDEAKIPIMKLPVSPLIQANHRLAESKMFGSVFANAFIRPGQPLIPPGLLEASTRFEYPRIQPYVPKVSENVVSIEIESLMHTREIDFKGLVLIPRKQGSFEVKFSVICEEMPLIQRGTFLVKVA